MVSGDGMGGEWRTRRVGCNSMMYIRHIYSTTRGIGDYGIRNRVLRVVYIGDKNFNKPQLES